MTVQPLFVRDEEGVFTAANAREFGGTGVGIEPVANGQFGARDPTIPGRAGAMPETRSAYSTNGGLARLKASEPK
jgi:hypothetical protein